MEWYDVMCSGSTIEGKYAIDPNKFILARYADGLMTITTYYDYDYDQEPVDRTRIQQFDRFDRIYLKNHEETLISFSADEAFGEMVLTYLASKNVSIDDILLVCAKWTEKTNGLQLNGINYASRVASYINPETGDVAKKLGLSQFAPAVAAYLTNF